MSEIYVCAVCRDPVVDAPRDQWTSTRVVPGGWRHLDDSPLCPVGAPARVDEPDPADPDAAAFTAALRDMFPADGGYDPARTATALTALTAITGWLRAATGPICAPATTPAGSDLARILSRLFQVTRTHTIILVNLARHADALAGPDAAWAVRTAGHLAAAARLAARAAADTAEGWQAARAAARPASQGPACGCPPRCVSCHLPLGAGHDLHCQWRRGSVPHESPVIAAQQVVLAGHIHRPGCPQVTRRPGGLFERLTDDGDVRCLMCAALNTYEGHSFPSYGATTEHHHRCTFLGRHLRFSPADLATIVADHAQPAGTRRRRRRRGSTSRDPDLITSPGRSVDPPDRDDHNRPDGSSTWPG